MIWRAAAAMAVLFWAVMTGLLIRDVYFPDESRFAEVPPRFVFDLFLKQSHFNQNSLHLYHLKNKIGNANLQIAERLDAKARQPYYGIIANGTVDGDSAGDPLKATWNLNGSMDAAGDWRQFEFILELPSQELSATVKWLEGATAPSVQVIKNKKPILDTQNLSTWVALGASGMQDQPMLAALGLMGGTQPDLKQFQITAREGIMLIAGRERKCFLVYMPMPGGQQVKMFFSETGELARVDLPQDYHLYEPMIHGLIPQEMP